MDREAATLPAVAAEAATAVLDLLVTERAGALAEATRLRHPSHQLLLQRAPQYREQLPNLQTQAGLKAGEAYRAASTAELAQQRAAAVRRLANRRRLALEQADALEQQIGTRAAADFSPRTRWCGINLRTAGALAGIMGPGRRLTTEAQLAASAGGRRRWRRHRPAGCATGSIAAATGD